MRTCTHFLNAGGFKRVNFYCWELKGQCALGLIAVSLDSIRTLFLNLRGPSGAVGRAQSEEEIRQAPGSHVEPGHILDMNGTTNTPILRLCSQTLK